jgi:hypothetical protein
MISNNAIIFGMFDSTFFKFLIAFAIIIGTSFLIMGIAGGYDTKNNQNNSAQTVIPK